MGYCVSVLLLACEGPKPGAFPGADGSAMRLTGRDLHPATFVLCRQRVLNRLQSNYLTDTCWSRPEVRRGYFCLQFQVGFERPFLLIVVDAELKPMRR